MRVERRDGAGAVVLGPHHAYLDRVVRPRRLRRSRARAPSPSPEVRPDRARSPGFARRAERRFVRVRDALLVIREARGELEDRVGALGREHPARGEIAAVADARHREVQRRARPAGAQEVAVDRVQPPDLDGRHRGHRRLRRGETAEEAPHPAGGRRLEEVVADAREREAIEHASERIALRVPLCGRHGEWIAAGCDTRQGARSIAVVSAASEFSSGSSGRSTSIHTSLMRRATRTGLPAWIAARTSSSVMRSAVAGAFLQQRVAGQQAESRGRRVGEDRAHDVVVAPGDRA